MYSGAPSSTGANPPPSPTAPTTLALTVVQTFPPILLANFPTPEGGFVFCRVCGSGYFVYDKTANVTISGLSFACSVIEIVGIQRGIPDAFCNTTLLEAVRNSYGCRAFTPSTPLPPTAPLTPTAPTAMAPGEVFTIHPIFASYFPTPDGGFPVCYVCGEGYFVSNKNALVTQPGLRFTCRDLETGGLQGLFPGGFCNDWLRQAILNQCGWDKIMNAVAPSSTLQVPTLAPNTTGSGNRTSSKAPSSTSPPAATLAPTGSVLATASSLLLSVVR